MDNAICQLHSFLTSLTAEVLGEFSQHNLMFHTLLMYIVVKLCTYNPISNYNICMWNRVLPFGQPLYNHHVRFSQPCNLAQNATTLLQPYKFGARLLQSINFHVGMHHLHINNYYMYLCVHTSRYRLILSYVLILLCRCN